MANFNATYLPFGLNYGVPISSIIYFPSDPTKVRLTFLLPVIDTPGLRDPANYKIIPTLAISAVTPEAIANPNYVDLTVAAQTDGVAYAVEMVWTDQ